MILALELDHQELMSSTDFSLYLDLQLSAAVPLRLRLTNKEMSETMITLKSQREN